jgi:hypothetical protein
MKWDPWQPKSIDFDGSKLFWSHRGLFYGTHWKKARGHKAKDKLLMHKTTGSENTLRGIIATKLSVPIDRIKINMSEVHPWGHLHYVNTGCLHAFTLWRVPYYVRTGKLICAEWEETWTERCSIR